MARLAIQDGSLEVTVPTDFMAGLIDRRFGPALRRAAGIDAEPSGARTDVPLLRSVRFRVDESEFTGSKARARSAPGRAAGRPAEPASPRFRARPAPRVLRYRLDEFVVGESNRLAFSAATRVAEGDARFCPLFIHGGCGLGKTHLLQGLAEQFRVSRRGAVVRIITAEAFTNAFLSAMKDRTLDEFRRRFRSADMLCIDDVHFLRSKKATQAELLHTFDALDLDGKLVALASDEHPSEIGRFSEALISRFLSGALVELSPPDDDLRRRVARAMAKRRGLDLDEQAAGMLSEHARAMAAARGGAPSMRDLEGLVTKVVAAARLMPDLSSKGAAGSAALVRAALGLGTDSPARSARPLRVEEIIRVVCARLEVSHEEYASNRRSREVVLARALTVLLARKRTRASFPEIARAMNRPNHSSVITALKRIQSQIAAAEQAELPVLGRAMPLSLLAEQLEHELACLAR